MAVTLAARTKRERNASKARRPGRARFDDQVRAVFVGEPVEHPRLEESALRLARIVQRSELEEDEHVI